MDDERLRLRDDNDELCCCSCLISDDDSLVRFDKCDRKNGLIWILIVLTFCSCKGISDDDGWYDETTNKYTIMKI
jgi:hypothetical protein